ncbi:MAG: NAD-dependent epimerase/dehydratase family protein [Planctomycetota bacterium]
MLVTGASGFIGSWVARRFVDRGDEVFALVRPPAVRLGLEGVTAIEGDLDDPATLEPLESLSPNVVCHLGANTRFDATEAETEANVRGTKNLVEALGKSIEGTRFLFASSIAAVDRTRRPRAPLTTEDTPAPRSPYAKSKLLCEELLRREAADRGFGLAILRLSSIYGPGQESGGVLVLADAVRSGGLAARLPWPGRISFCFVEDVAEVFHRLAHRPEPAEGTWFVAEDRGHSMADAARIIADVTGEGKPPWRWPLPFLKLANFFMWLPGARGFAPWSLRAALADTILCDSEPLKELTGVEWTPLAEGLARTFGPAERASPAPAFEAGAVRSVVTGATGFLGSALAASLAEANGADSVVGLVRDPLPEAERAAAESLREAGVRLVPADLMRSPVGDVLDIEPDVLYHLAAETDSAAPPDRLEVNTRGTKNLLESFGGRLRGKRVVLAGATAAVDRAGRPRGLMKETDRPAPRTAYGASKLMAERILALAADRYGFAWSVPRFSPVWTTDLATGFLSAFKDQVVGRSLIRRVAWPGRITMVRREDAVRILRHLGETGAADGKAVHVGDGEVYRYADLLRDIRRLADDAGWFLPIPRFKWAALRWFAWLPVFRKFVPWRLSCLLGDDLAVDASLLRSLYPEPMLTWPASREEIRIVPGDPDAL